MDEWSPYPDNLEMSSRVVRSNHGRFHPQNQRFLSMAHQIICKMKLKLKALDVTRNVLICYVYLVCLIKTTKMLKIKLSH